VRGPVGAQNMGQDQGVPGIGFLPGDGVGVAYVEFGTCQDRVVPMGTMGRLIRVAQGSS
jgi:hypothetical protein